VEFARYQEFDTLYQFYVTLNFLIPTSHRRRVVCQKGFAVCLRTTGSKQAKSAGAVGNSKSIFIKTTMGAGGGSLSVLYAIKELSRGEKSTNVNIRGMLF
jgi:hypothetical protein